MKRRLDYMVSELGRCQNASVTVMSAAFPAAANSGKPLPPGAWKPSTASGCPWYNLHKTYAGLRDAYWLTGNEQARDILVRCGDWCETVTAGLSDEQMQRMLSQEHAASTKF